RMAALEGASLTLLGVALRLAVAEAAAMRWSRSLVACMLVQSACASQPTAARRTDVGRAPPPPSAASKPGTSTPRGATLLESAFKDYQSGHLDAAFTKANRAHELLAASGDVRAAAASELVGHVQLNRKACEPAASAYEETVHLREMHFGPDHPSLAAPLRALAEALSCTGKADAAIAAVRRAYQIESAFPARLGERVDLALVLAALFNKRGELHRAESVLGESMAAVEVSRGRADPLYGALFGVREATLRALGNKEAAAALWVGLPESDLCLPEACPDPRSPAAAETRAAAARSKRSDVPNSSRVLAALAPSFKACYDRGLTKDPSIVGRVLVTMRIAADGSVGSVKGHRVGFLDDATITCILKAALAARFDASAASERVARVPLTFVPPAPAVSL
ncbi:MAG TPA: AgmX/PglI C-terminal domain-containing protein, partial [Polyangiaceae bacterium]|nr:AgmX/PglI C-terminal domain-containing protein [Polyangiaceae bacterium]